MSPGNCYDGNHEGLILEDKMHPIMQGHCNMRGRQWNVTLIFLQHANFHHGQFLSLRFHIFIKAVQCTCTCSTEAYL